MNVSDYFHYYLPNRLEQVISLSLSSWPFFHTPVSRWVDFSFCVSSVSLSSLCLSYLRRVGTSRPDSIASSPSHFNQSHSVCHGRPDWRQSRSFSRSYRTLQFAPWSHIKGLHGHDHRLHRLVKWWRCQGFSLWAWPLTSCRRPNSPRRASHCFS